MQSRKGTHQYSIAVQGERAGGGRVRVKLWYDHRVSKLAVTVLEAQGLPAQDSTDRNQPYAFVRICLTAPRK